MACFLISYDLKGPDRDYEAVISCIKEYGTWAHIRGSLWAIVTEISAKEIRSDLKQHLKSGDRLFVSKTAKGAAWSNVMCRNEWLKKHLGNV